MPRPEARAPQREYQRALERCAVVAFRNGRVPGTNSEERDLTLPRHKAKPAQPVRRTVAAGIYTLQTGPKIR